MQELYAYLSQWSMADWALEPEDTSEPQIMVYYLLKDIVYEQCTIITVNSHKITWARHTDGNLVGEFDTPVSFLPYFERARKKDRILTAHLQLVEQTEQSATYHIV